MDLLRTDALLELIHRYYPAALDSADPQYAESEEGQRLTQLVNAHVGGTQPWKDFIQRLHRDFSDCSVWDATVPYHDPCYICRVSLPGFVVGSPRYDSVVCLLSQLAPVYALYASHVEDKGPGSKRDHWLGFPPFPSEFQDHERRLAELIESTLGATRLSNDVLFTPVPDRVPRTGHFQLGEAKLIDCLFTPYRT
ncbi:hypothetical protein BON30_38810 [Cystobacter ferrugineus]|uniref:Uncharacterized protein n=1 Tax=Cystobacter ferrugineus TaxID=83449 RepID=A0A1L9AZQ7_9BACT|nr:hypothetical protein BON30_38810 [Cystobacter ferrugineus]